MAHKTIHQHLKAARVALSEVVDQSNLEADILLSYSLKKPRSYLYAWPNQCLTPKENETFSACLARRQQKEPIAYIIGKKAFWSLTLKVTNATLIPRPETELLVQTILEFFPDKHSLLRIADLGTGSGNIALALASERPAWLIVATDQSESALKIAKQNREQYQFSGVSFYLGSWYEALPCGGFDVIVSNPPYIGEEEWHLYASGLQFEPHSALLAGKDGLASIREIINKGKNYLKPRGVLLIEHGFSQDQLVRQIFAAANYSDIKTYNDFAHYPRITIGKS